MGSLIAPETREIARKLLEEGLTLKQVALTCTVGESFVRRFAKTVTRGPCGCGRPADHGGHCRFRFKVNPRVRSARLSIWRSTKKWTDQADKLVIRDYAAGVQTKLILDLLDRSFSLRVTAGALRQRASDLGVERPPRCPKYRRSSFHPLRWTAAAVKILEEDYARGVKTSLIVERLKTELDLTVSEDALRKHASRLGITHPAVILSRKKKVSKVRLPEWAIEEPTPAPTILLKIPFSMTSMRAPDPFREVRLRQLAQASRGRL